MDAGINENKKVTINRIITEAKSIQFFVYIEPKIGIGDRNKIAPQKAFLAACLDLCQKCFSAFPEIYPLNSIITFLQNML